MPSPTNLTERLAQLRERKGGSPILQTRQPAPEPAGTPAKRSARERKPAADYFLIFSYGLLAVALAVQLALLLWLDIT